MKTSKMDMTYIADRVSDMIDADVDRDKAFEDYERMSHCEWERPDGLKDKDWIRLMKSSDCADVLRTGARVLSTLDENVKINPLDDDANSRRLANKLEKGLKWHLLNSSRRRQSTLRYDFTRSALMYDEIVACITYLPYQKKLLGDSLRMDGVNRYCPFIVNIFNPKMVHSRFSDNMLEEIVSVKTQDPLSVLDFWGDAAKELQEWDEDEVVVFDYWSRDYRAVWVSKQVDGEVGDGVVLIKPQAHGLPFLPWVCRVGGTTLESEPEHQRQPLLYTVHQTGQYDNLNIIETIVYSEAIAHAAEAKGKKMGPGADEIKVEAGEPTNDVVLKPGQDYQRLMPAPIDTGLLGIADRVRGNIEKSTVSRLLQGGSIPAGMSYAALNLSTTTDLGVLKPYKELSELGLADVCTIFVEWCKHNGDDLVGYGTNQSKSKGKVDYGKKYMVLNSELDPENLYVQINLNPDLPIDKQQRINGASQLYQNLGVALEDVLEDIGISDPAATIKRRRIEEMTNGEFQNYLADTQLKIQRKQGMLQLELQAKGAQMQQDMQAQAMQQQQPQGPGLEQPQPGTPPGLGPETQGEGFNPAMGGEPPQMANPEATFEGQTGQPRTAA